MFSTQVAAAVAAVAASRESLVALSCVAKYENMHPTTTLIFAAFSFGLATPLSMRQAHSQTLAAMQASVSSATVHNATEVLSGASGIAARSAQSGQVMH